MKEKNRKTENMMLNALHTKIRHTSWYALFVSTGSYLCTLHMLPIRSHILRKLAVTFIAFACRLATKRRLAFSGYPGRIDTL